LWIGDGRRQTQSSSPLAFFDGTTRTVGVGLVNPASFSDGFTVQLSSNNGWPIGFTNAAEDVKGAIRTDQGDNYIAFASKSESDIRFFYNDNEANTALIVKGSGATAGNVGIGTTAPSAKLHVDGDIRIDGGHTLDFQTKAYIDVNLLDGTGDDLFYIRRRGSSNEIAIDTSTASAPIIDSPNGTIDLQAASNPVVQLKDDTGFIMQDNMGVKNHVATLANFPIDIGSGIATADIQGFSKIQNISLAAYAGGGLPTNLDVKLPVGAAGMEFIVTLGDTALNLGSLTLRLVANGSDVIYNAANAVSNISYTKNVGESIHLICFEANKWSVVAHT